MNCIIPSLNIKVLAKALQALAKVGDEVFIEAKEEKLTFLTFNQSKTVCGQFHMLDSFFSLYTVKKEQFNENSAIGFKIHMKTLLPTFKGTNLDKKLENIKIEYTDSCDTVKFKVKYKNDDIVMSHSLYLLDPETLAIDSYTNSQNNLCAGSDFFNGLLNFFSTTDDSITLEITKTSIVARNYYIGAPHNPKSVRSHVNLNNSEFSLYRIREETTVNFSLKPFRTVIAFAESLNLNMGIDFDIGGRPLSMCIRNPTFELIFIVATINPYTDGQSTIGPNSLPAKITQVNNANHNLTTEDLEAIANENWDEFDSEDATASKIDKHLSSKSKRNSAKEALNILDKNKKATSKGRKLFLLEDKNNASAANNNVTQMEVDGYVIPGSPERIKRMRYIFKGAFEPSFDIGMVTNILASDSDLEDEG